MLDLCEVYQRVTYDKRYARLWRKRNKPKIAEYNRRRRASRSAYKRRLRAKNPEAAREHLQRWFAAHPGKRNEYRAAYLARKKLASVNLTSKEKVQLTAIYRKARLRTLATGVAHHVDHIIPLSRGGKHRPTNLQVLTAAENRRKHTKLMKEM